jgi:hypothetical protein
LEFAPLEFRVFRYNLEKATIMIGKRIAVWTLSVLAGAASATGVILFFNTSLERFSFSNALLIFLAIGSLVFIWLDYFLKTEYIRT